MWWIISTVTQGNLKDKHPGAVQHQNETAVSYV